MYERLLNKNLVPDTEFIKSYLGESEYELFEKLDEILNNRYDINRELRFPFGNKYGWGYKYSHKSKHLFYLFIEKNAFTVMLQIGDNDVQIMDKMVEDMSEYAKNLWANRYPCGEDGGWIQYRVLSNSDLEEIIKIIEIRKKPNIKV